MTKKETKSTKEAKAIEEPKAVEETKEAKVAKKHTINDLSAKGTELNLAAAKFADLFKQGVENLPMWETRLVRTNLAKHMSATIRIKAGDPKTNRILAARANIAKAQAKLAKLVADNS